MHGAITHIIHYWGGHFGGHYVDWRARRIAVIVQHYGPGFFDGKTLVEVGAGHADIGAVFARMGAKVTAVEGRQENVDAIETLTPEVTALLADLDGKWPSLEPFDIVLHLGLLYHLKHFEESLRLACANGKHLILETEVSDSDDPFYVLHPTEASSHYDQALGGVGSRPSPAYVERILTECGMKFQRIEEPQLNTVYARRGIIDHYYAWPIQNTGKWASGWRKMWFAEKV